MAAERKDNKIDLAMDAPFSDYVDSKGFDVTVETVVGHVAYGHGEYRSPIHAAFEVIANHIIDTGNGADGVYRFPGPDEGSETVVTVEGS